MCRRRLEDVHRDMCFCRRCEFCEKKNNLLFSFKYMDSHIFYKKPVSGQRLLAVFYIFPGSWRPGLESGPWASPSGPLELRIWTCGFGTLDVLRLTLHWTPGVSPPQDPSSHLVKGAKKDLRLSGVCEKNAHFEKDQNAQPSHPPTPQPPRLQC